MNRHALVVSALLSLPGLAAAQAYQQALQCASGPGCWGERDPQAMPVQAGALSDADAGLVVTPPQMRRPDGSVPFPVSPKPPKKPLLQRLEHGVKKYGPMALFAGAGGYLGFLAAGALTLTPFGGVVFGAAIGVLLAMVLLPKITALFHHKKG